jgi:hypothetical protein
MVAVRLALSRFKATFQICQDCSYREIHENTACYEKAVGRYFLDPPRSTSQEELFSTCFATFLRLPWRVNASIISIHQDDSRRDLFVGLHLLQYLEIQMSAVSQISRSSSRVYDTFRAGQPDGISRVCEEGLN